MCPFFECNRLLLLLKPALQSLFYIIDEVYKLNWFNNEMLKTIIKEINFSL